MEESEKKKIQLVILTPYRTFYEGYVDSVVIPAYDGGMGIMAGHMPVVSALAPGIGEIKVNNEVLHFCSSEGYAEIGQHLCMIITNAAEWPEDINVARTFNAFIKSSKDKEQYDFSKEAYSDRKDAYLRAVNRINAIEKYGTEEQKASLRKKQGKEENE